MQASLHGHFRTCARYNLWATERLYTVCAGLTESAYRQRCPISGRSLHGVLNHLLVINRLWLARLRGYESDIVSVHEELHDDLESLRDATVAEDVILYDYVHGLSEEDLMRPVAYRNLAGEAHANAQAEMLTHLFSRQIEHRGEACGLVERTEEVPPKLGFIRFLASD